MTRLCCNNIRSTHQKENRLEAGQRTVIERVQLQIDHNRESEVDELLSSFSERSKIIRKIKLTPQDLLNGVARLTYEVGESKVDGGESRLSGTSIDDMRNNVVGIDFARCTNFASAIETRDGQLVAEAHDQRIEDDARSAGFATLRSGQAARSQRGLVMTL